MLSQPYPRGFVLAGRSIAPPPGFVPGPSFDHFFIEPLTAVDVAENDDLAVVVLGTCVSTDAEGSAHPSPAQRMLDALIAGEPAFFDLIDIYCGRHAILFGPKDRPRILTDATGMRTVFYAADGGVVASHARLVEEALGEEIERLDLPFRYGYPGNHTPYRRTRLLTPNTLYDLADSTVLRFWPRAPIKPMTVKRATEEVILRTMRALQRMALSHPLSLSLTAGIDSRATLALALKSGVPFDAYTYDRSANTAIDYKVAQALASLADISHTVVSAKTHAPADVHALLAKATYYRHHHSTVPPMQQHFGNSSSIAVTANLLEIGRYFYRGGIYDHAVPDHPEAMCAYSLFATGLTANEMDRDHGPEARQLATRFFADFIETTRFNSARGSLDPRDQFYWEYKMSAWHGMILLERDFYADCFIPFNARAVFKALLAVPVRDRKRSTVFKRLIQQCAPQLTRIPINPPEWPPDGLPTSLPVRFRRAIKENAVRIEQGLNRRGFRPATRSTRKLLRALGMRKVGCDLSENGS
jgi:hypothetical protein